MIVMIIGTNRILVGVKKMLCEDFSTVMPGRIGPVSSSGLKVVGVSRDVKVTPMYRWSAEIETMDGSDKYSVHTGWFDKTTIPDKNRMLEVMKRGLVKYIQTGSGLKVDTDGTLSIW